MTIQLSVVVGLAALAEVGARRVDAVLTAHRGLHSTLVLVGTSLSILEQLVAFIALTVEARQGVDTLVLTLVHLHFGTLVDITVRRFVRPVAAVLLLVAHPFIRNALPILAGELGTRARCHLLLAVFLELIAAVTAVVLPIAVIRLPDALGISARELF